MITTKKSINFIVRNIICRLGFRQTIVTDNGTQFNNAEFKDFCHRLHIEKRFTVIVHPQPNGQVEAMKKNHKVHSEEEFGKGLMKVGG